ncbi:hypothetical protein [Kitasatospora aureofaciens]|uniref:hypothetical protein n=1 Tax=Kitasatospora aureofaciens TaxID=1894 RepID=UPI0036F49AAF
MSNLGEGSEPVPVGYVVEYRPFAGDVREIRVTGEQLHGQACVIGAECAGGGELVDSGHVYTSTSDGQPVYGWPVVAHRKCLAGQS